MYVVMFHVTAIAEENGLIIADWIRPILKNGGTGVTLFFVISAFTLCFTLNFQQKENQYLKNFYTRRIFRIAPLYYLWLFIYLAINHFHAHPYKFIAFSTFTFNAFPSTQAGYVSGSWTIGVEMAFYSFFPFLFKVINTLNKALVFFAVTCCVAIIHYNVMDYIAANNLADLKNYRIIFSLLNNLPIFALGIVTYFLYEKLKAAGNNVHAYMLIAGIMIFTILPYLAFNNAYRRIAVVIFGVAYLLIFLGLSKIDLRIIVNKVSVFFGKISYSVYLNHMFIAFRMGKIFKWIFAYQLPSLISLLLCICVTLIIVVPISYLTYRFIELPFINWGKKIIKNRKEAVAVA